MANSTLTKEEKFGLLFLAGLLAALVAVGGIVVLNHGNGGTVPGYAQGRTDGM